MHLPVELIRGRSLAESGLVSVRLHMVSVKIRWRMLLRPRAAMGSRERAEAHGTERDSSRRFARSQRGCFVNVTTLTMNRAAAINHVSHLAFNCVPSARGWSCAV